MGFTEQGAIAWYQDAKQAEAYFADDAHKLANLYSKRGWDMHVRTV